METLNKPRMAHEGLVRCFLKVLQGRNEHIWPQ